MASEAELKAEKFYLPADTDGIYAGAATFRANAAAAYDWAKKVAQAQASTVKKELQDTIEQNHLADKKIQATIPANADLDAYRTQGHYLINNGSTARTLLNYPPGANLSSAELEVSVSSSGYGTQLIKIAGKTPQIFYRGNASTKGAPNFPWGAWAEITRAQSIPDIPANADLDAYRTQGVYRINNGATARTLLNYPPGANLSSAELEVSVSSSGYGTQLIKIAGKTPQIFYRGHASIEGAPNFPWAGWAQIPDTSMIASSAADNSLSATTDDPTTAALRNQLLVEDFTRRYGVSTGGRAAVAFRFDHGLKNFADIVLPMLREFGFPSSQAINSRSWNKTENAGITAQIVNEWVKNDRVEIWNHSATHLNAADMAGLKREIVEGLTELRQQIPDASIDGWAVPGVGSTANGQAPYMGMGTGTAAYQFSSSVAGQLILANHAVSTGHISGSHQRRLDGTVRNGLHHFGLDTRANSTLVKAEIDKAIKEKTGLQLFLHPSLVGTDGGISVATLREIFQYIEEKQDAGQLVVLSPYQLVAASL